MKTKSKILKSSKQFPLLIDYGAGLPYGTKIRHRAKKIKEGKQRLIQAERQFEDLCGWLGGIEKTKSINTWNCSYYLKHLAEKRLGIGYISNGTFIAAAVYCGFKYKRASGPNLVFNMSQESIDKAHQESMRYQKYPNNQDLIHGGLMN